MSHRNVVNCLWGKPFRHSAAPRDPRLVGQFWGLDSDRVFEFSSDRSYSPTRLNVLPGAADPWAIAFKNSSRLTGSSISGELLRQVQ